MSVQIQFMLSILLRCLNVALIFGLVFLVCGRLEAPRPAPASAPLAFYPPPDPLPAVEMLTLPAPPEPEPEEQQKKPKAANEPWWIVLKTSEDDYERSHSGSPYWYTRVARWHYSDCLIQRAHYRLRRRAPAKLRRLRRLEKALDDWGMAYCEKTYFSLSAGGAVFSVAHLECGIAIDRIVQSYRHPKDCPGGASALRKTTQALVKECARLNRTPDEEFRERPNIPQQVTRRLLRETRPLTGEAAQAVAKYITATLNDVIE